MLSHSAENFESSNQLLDPSRVVEAADEAIRRFEGLGLRVHRGSRLPEAREVIASMIGRRSSDPRNRARADEIADASLTILDLYTMSHCTVPGTVEAARVEKYRRALAGPPRGDVKKHCAARDFQFEMLFGSWMAICGWGTSLGEPDLLVQLDTGVYGVAAKRIESRKKIEERTSEAIKQIERSRMPGFIALNLDQVVRDPFVTSHPTNPEGGVFETIRELRIHDRQFRHDQVFGRICVARKFRWIENGDPPGLYVVGHLLVEPWLDASVPERRVADDLRALMNGIVGVATRL